MFSSMIDAEIQSQRRAELLREAKLRHALREAEQNPSTVQERWLNLIADLLIKSGTQIKSRYQPSSTPTSEVTPREANAATSPVLF
jgi:hypothetical protein